MWLKLVNFYDLNLMHQVQ